MTRWSGQAVNSGTAARLRQQQVLEAHGADGSIRACHSISAPEADQPEIILL